MSGELASIKVAFLDVEGRPSAGIGLPAVGYQRVWCNSTDSSNLYALDAAGNNVQITKDGGLAVGNVQYMWDWFENGVGVTIPAYSVVRLLSGGITDGKLALSDSDEISQDSFLGIVYGGDILAGQLGKVIYSGKVPGAVAGLSLPSMTTIYMSNVPGTYTHVTPSFLTDTLFMIGFTKGDDLYLRPTTLSELG